MWPVSSSSPLVRTQSICSGRSLESFMKGTNNQVSTLERSLGLCKYRSEKLGKLTVKVRWRESEQGNGCGLC